MTSKNFRVLMITSEWPSPERPEWVPFLVQQVDYLRKAGTHVDVFSFRGAKNPMNYLKAWLRARKEIRSQHYDLIHAQFGQSGLIALPKLRPLVVTFHGSDLHGDVSSNGLYTLQGKFLKLVSQIVALFADEIIVVSPALGQLIARRKSCHIIPCGLDLELFQPMDRDMARQKLGLPGEKRLVLFGGRPEMPVKRYSLANQAVDLVIDSDVEMIAVSNVAHNRMPLYLNACDVLLLTSLHEGSPTIVKEALACNLPIVSTDVGDIRDRIVGVEGCIVCEDERPETIAQGLEQVLRKRQRVNGRKAVNNLDERILTQEILAVYQHALTGRRDKLL